MTDVKQVNPPNVKALVLVIVAVFALCFIGIAIFLKAFVFFALLGG